MYNLVERLILSVLLCFPGIGDKKAKNALPHIDCVMDIAVFSNSRWQAITGFSNTLVTTIQTLLVKSKKET